MTYITLLIVEVKMKKIILQICVISAIMICTHVNSQDWTKTPKHYLKLVDNFRPNPQRIDLSSGGSIPPAAYDRTGKKCRGYVTEAPQVDVYYQADNTNSRNLTFEVLSQADTTLLTTGPEGGWDCQDDTEGGLNPKIIYKNAKTGLYSVWVGTYSRSDRFRPATLQFSD